MSRAPHALIAAFRARIVAAHVTLYGPTYGPLKANVLFATLANNYGRTGRRAGVALAQTARRYRTLAREAARHA